VVSLAKKASLPGQNFSTIFAPAQSNAKQRERINFQEDGR
jgi:hypothetical protein